ncbi:hypothetical protein PRIPAC_95650 [Pristionchus pacificus]|uniref:Uncharacterized protein n=1 Tax=Pristionchus pacificus TaxID=54126 RepID=A0A2A6D324_PRIPA|nr:hypothetical protein PRIPAC_95650 [Pristionchus pacificus]|eukprot:PDM84799.1 hypothetical protein PRIPAC_33822 [Pristionchus pacificus]
MIVQSLRICILFIAFVFACDAMVGQYFYGGNRVMASNPYYKYYRPYPWVLAYQGPYMSADTIYGK